MAAQQQHDLEKLPDHLNYGLVLQPQNESVMVTLSEILRIVDERDVHTELTFIKEVGKQRPAVSMLVCNADASNRVEEINDKDKLLEYLMLLVRFHFHIYPYKPCKPYEPYVPFLLFLTEFNVNYADDLRGLLEVEFKKRGLPCVIEFVKTDGESYGTLILYNNSTVWQPEPYYMRLEDKRHVAIRLKNRWTNERLLCICVHLPHKGGKEEARKALNYYLPNATKEGEHKCEYIVVAGDFNEKPSVIRENLPNLKFVISDDNICTKRCRRLSGPEKEDNTPPESSKDNVATYGPLTANIKMLCQEYSLFDHYPIYCRLNFTG